MTGRLKTNTRRLTRIGIFISSSKEDHHDFFGGRGGECIVVEVHGEVAARLVVEACGEFVFEAHIDTEQGVKLFGDEYVGYFEGGIEVGAIGVFLGGVVGVVEVGSKSIDSKRGLVCVIS